MAIEQHIENLIIGNLIENNDFIKAVFPYIKDEYFENDYAKEVFKIIKRYYVKYNKTPSKDIIEVELNTVNGLDSVLLNQAKALLSAPIEKVDRFIMIDKTEEWCQDRAVFNAIIKSIDIIDGKNQSLDKNALPDILKEALSINFDAHIGHDYMHDVDYRFDFYHSNEPRIPSGIELFDKITDGGLPRKTLNLFMGGPGAGKSLTLCSLSASYLLGGYNVLYITLEMAEERIAQRIDANLLNVPLKELRLLSKAKFQQKVDELRAKKIGNLIVKEFPTSQAHAGHFRALLQDLELKKGFKPDVVVIDYVGICASSRLRSNGSNNSYTIGKAVTEEIRGLMVEYNVVGLSAQQYNRDGIGNSDVDMKNASDSIATAFTADSMFALITNEKFEEQGVMLLKQLKNRYNDLNYYNKILIGVDRSRMKLFNVDQSVANISGSDSGKPKEDDTPAFDKSAFGTRMKKEEFGGFNFQ